MANILLVLTLSNKNITKSCGGSMQNPKLWPHPPPALDTYLSSRYTQDDRAWGG
jgi:hypothetical protein